MSQEERQTLRPAPDLPDQKVTEMLLAKEMTDMSITERSLVYEELHGVAKIVDETEELVQKSLHDLKQAIEAIGDKEAYKVALSKSPDYVGGKDFQLMFLRATSFDAKQAASQMVTFLEYKRLFYGDDILGRPIRYSDLDSDALKCLKSGWFQVVPFRDKSGRAVVWITQTAREKRGVISNLRAAMYFVMSVMEDIETQKSGVVIAGCGTESIDLSEESRNVLWETARLASYAPMRVVACHHCFHSKLLSPLVALQQIGTSKGIRARNRIHLGSSTEWMYSLMTFGIPTNDIPVSSGGKVKLKNHRSWLSTRAMLESSKDYNPSRSKEIYLPGRQDILLGRGTPTQQYSGNMLFHQVVEKYKVNYAEATKGAKKELVERVLDMLQKEYRCRFLERKNNGWWVEVPKEAAMKKISNRFRAAQSTPPAWKSVPCSSDPPPSFLEQSEHEDSSAGFACCKPMGDSKRAKV